MEDYTTEAKPRVYSEKTYRFAEQKRHSVKYIQVGTEGDKYPKYQYVDKDDLGSAPYPQEIVIVVQAA